MRRTSRPAAVLSFAVLAFAAWTAGSPAGFAEASLHKPNGSPPLDMPNTLALEMRASPGVELASLAPKTKGICAAAAVRVPGAGTKIVTARHCAGNVLAVFDEHHRVLPEGRSFLGEGVDLAVLDVRGELPWAGLEPRRSRTLRLGERLCAWRLEPQPGRLRRERICGRFVRRIDRSGLGPELEIGHPFPPGTSGSALVDSNGRVVGFVVSTTVENALAEPVDTVLAWAEREARASKQGER